MATLETTNILNEIKVTNDLSYYNEQLALKHATDAENSANKAKSEADKASASATNVESFANRAKSEADKASASAVEAKSTLNSAVMTITNTKNSATSAIQAEGNTQRTSLQGYVDSAKSYANSASASASTATTKASEIVTSANNAKTYMTNAQSYMNTAKTYQDNALSYKNSAQTSASVATEQANLATSKANEATEIIENSFADIESKTQEEINKIKQTGFYMQEDKLYYIGSNGETKEFNLIDAGRIAEELGNKLDSSNTEWAINSCMPDYSAKVVLGVLSEYRTLPCDCLVVFSADNVNNWSNSGFWFASPDKKVQSYYAIAHLYRVGNLGLNIQKGWKVKSYSNASTISYYPLKGGKQ